MDLIKIRFVAFGYQALSLIVVALTGVLASGEFKTLITENFGESVGASLILLGVNALVAHMRNLSIVTKVGGAGDKFLI